jgi:hypothetical protein
MDIFDVVLLGLSLGVNIILLKRVWRLEKERDHLMEDYDTMSRNLRVLHQMLKSIHNDLKLDQ